MSALSFHVCNFQVLCVLNEAKERNLHDSCFKGLQEKYGIEHPAQLVSRTTEERNLASLSLSYSAYRCKTEEMTHLSLLVFPDRRLKRTDRGRCRRKLKVSWRILRRQRDKRNGYLFLDEKRNFHQLTPFITSTLLSSLLQTGCQFQNAHPANLRDLWPDLDSVKSVGLIVGETCGFIAVRGLPCDSSMKSVVLREGSKETFFMWIYYLSAKTLQSLEKW